MLRDPSTQLPSSPLVPGVRNDFAHTRTGDRDASAFGRRLLRMRQVCTVGRTLPAYSNNEWPLLLRGDAREHNQSSQASRPCCSHPAGASRVFQEGRSWEAAFQELMRVVKKKKARRTLTFYRSVFNFQAPFRHAVGRRVFA